MNEELVAPMNNLRFQDQKHPDLNYTSALLETCAKHGIPAPIVVFRQPKGPPHAPTYVAEVAIFDKVFIGNGSSKKAARNAGSKLAYEYARKYVIKDIDADNSVKLELDEWTIIEAITVELIENGIASICNGMSDGDQVVISETNNDEANYLRTVIDCIYKWDIKSDSYSALVLKNINTYCRLHRADLCVNSKLRTCTITKRSDNVLLY